MQQAPDGAAGEIPAAARIGRRDAFLNGYGLAGRTEADQRQAEYHGGGRRAENVFQFHDNSSSFVTIIAVAYNEFRVTTLYRALFLQSFYLRMAQAKRRQDIFA